MQCVSRWILLCFLVNLAHAGVLGASAVIRNGAESKVNTRNPQSLYVLHCAGCHGLDGAGVSRAQVPDMRRLEAFLKIAGGREFVIKVPGVMGSGLDDQAVADVTNWVFLNLVQISADSFTPYSASEISIARLFPLKDVAATRLQLQQEAKAVGLTIP
jgi:cytochrome c553